MLEMKSIELTGVAFKQKRPYKTDAKFLYNLVLKNYKGVETVDEKSFHYDVQLEFDLMHKVRNSMMAFSCSYHAVYAGNAEDRANLKEHIVVAHTIPFLRELVSNITMRTEFPVLLLSPVNAVRLYKQFVERNSGSTEK